MVWACAMQSKKCIH